MFLMKLSVQESKLTNLLIAAFSLKMVYSDLFSTFLTVGSYSISLHVLWITTTGEGWCLFLLPQDVANQ